MWNLSAILEFHREVSGTEAISVLERVWGLCLVPLDKRPIPDTREFPQEVDVETGRKASISLNIIKLHLSVRFPTGRNATVFLPSSPPQLWRPSDGGTRCGATPH